MEMETQFSVLRTTKSRSSPGKCSAEIEQQGLNRGTGLRLDRDSLHVAGTFRWEQGRVHVLLDPNLW